MFDEPLSNLDAKLRVQMRAEISSLHSRLQATMIYVTHDQVEAMTMGDKIVVMKDGIIQQIGDPLTLYNKPVNRFVAGFIGSPPMNFVALNIKEEGGKVIGTEGASTIELADNLASIAKNYANKQLILGVRPEDITYKKTDKNTLKTTIEVVEPLGAEIHLYANTGNHQLIVRTPPTTDWKVGESANFSLNQDRCLLFDLETEQTLNQ